MRDVLLPSALAVRSLVVIGLAKAVRGDGSASTFVMSILREIGRKAAAIRWAAIGTPGVNGWLRHDCILCFTILASEAGRLVPGSHARCAQYSEKEKQCTNKGQKIEFLTKKSLIR